MVNFIKEIGKKINGLIWSLVSTGIILLFLGILIVWTDFILRLVIGLFVLLVAWIFLYGGYKLWTLKKEVEKYLKLK